VRVRACGEADPYGSPQLLGRRRRLNMTPTSGVAGLAPGIQTTPPGHPHTVPKPLICSAVHQVRLCASGLCPSENPVPEVLP
jgi:hypothetical protein